jgi:hypothetical protein
VTAVWRLVSGHIERQLLLIFLTLQEVADVVNRAAVSIRKDRADEGEACAPSSDLLSVRLAVCMCDNAVDIFR